METSGDSYVSRWVKWLRRSARLSSRPSQVKIDPEGERNGCISFRDSEVVENLPETRHRPCSSNERVPSGLAGAMRFIAESRKLTSGRGSSNRQVPANVVICYPRR